MFLNRVVRPPIRAFVHSFEGVWLASDSSTCSNGLLYSLSFPLDKRQGDLGLKENGQHRKRNRTGAITMEAAVEELTPLGVLKQPNEGWTYSRAGEVHSNLAGARDIERRAIPKGAMPAVPPPAWKLGFDQPCRSVNRACHMGGDRAKCTLERAVEFRRANGSGLDSVQKFSQVHFSYPPWADDPNCAPTCLASY